MSMISDKSDLNEREIDLFKVMSDFRPVFAKYKHLIIGMPVLFMLIGVLLTKMVAPKWEATAFLQIGRISRSELIEPISNVSLRLNSATLKAVVLNECAIPAGSDAAKVYKGALTAKEGTSSSLVEIKVRGLSKESTMKLAGVTARQIESMHAAKILPIINSLKRQRDETARINQNIFSVLEGGKKSTGWNNSLMEMLSLYFVNELGLRAFQGNERIQIEGIAPTEIIDIAIGESPVSPKKIVWMSWAGLFGFFLGIAISLTLNSVNQPNRLA